MYRQTFFDIFYIFDGEWRKRVQKKYSTNIDEKISMLCADEMLKHLKLVVDDIRLNYFWLTF